MTIPSRSGSWLIWLGLLAACRLDPVEDLAIADEPESRLPREVIPLSTERRGDDTAQRWDASLQRYLAFLTSPELSGRRPGTEGGQLTAGFVRSVLEAAGVSPNGPDLGWTQPVGIRVVQTHDVVLTVHPAAGETETEPPSAQRFEEELWVRHRGAAGERSDVLRLTEPVALPAPSPPSGEPAAPSTPLDLLTVLPLPSLPEGSAAEDVIREAFDGAWRDGASVAVLPIPDPEQGALLRSAESWQQPELQSVRLGRDPPAALDLEGFVGSSLYQALLDARARPGSTAELQYVAEERWFEDANIIGRIAGGRRPEQVVVLVAHWDAGGLLPPDTELGSIANATGLAVMLAVAEASGRWREAGRRPERSLVFVATAAGTLGHRGAIRFLEASGIRPSNIAAVINLEHLGGTESDLLVLDGERSSLLASVVALAPTARPLPDEGGVHGHRPFLGRRVPAITLSRPGIRLEDGSEPEPSLLALRSDAELTFRLLWALSDRADLPRLVEPEAEPPAEP